MAERSPEIEQQIVDGLSEGTTLREMCRSLDVGKSSVYRWMEDDADFAGRIARAREAGFDAIAEEGLAIVDKLDEDPTSRRVRSEYRLKLLAKWDPKRYGELLKHSGPAGDEPVQVAVSVSFRKPDAADEG